jgi:peptide/nickel transport system substrate-binding protein
MKAKQPSPAMSRVIGRLQSILPMRRIAAAGAVLLATVPLLTAACASSATTSSAAKLTTLRIAVGTEPLPNPAQATVKGYWSSIFFSLAYAPIFHLAVNGTVEPGLAVSWHYINSTQNRNEVFEFTLRPNAKFSDGSPVTAKDVAHWLAYFVGQTGPFHGVFGVKPSFSAISSLTVRIRMTSPNPELPDILSDQGDNAGFVMSPKAIADPGLLSSATDGAGPYELLGSQSVRGDHYTYVPNPHYYDKPALKFHQVYVKVIADPSSRLQAQETGQYNVTLGDATTAAAAKSAGLEVLSVPQGVQFLALDSKAGLSPALKDVRVRQAINYAINRPAIEKALFGAFSAPESAFLPADISTGLSSYYRYDPTKAKALLAAAGYAHGFTLNAICQGSYFGDFGYPLVSAVAQELQAVGIHLNVTSYPTDPIYASHVFATPAQATVSDLLQIYTDTPSLYNVYLSPTAPVNFYGTNAELDRLYEEGAASSDPQADWKAMWKVYASEAYIVPLVINPNLYYVSKGVGGVALSPLHNAALPTEWHPTSGQ